MKRRLLDITEKFLHNCWDDAELDKENFDRVVSKIENDGAQGAEYVVASDAWNVFYANHANKFFKDRSWIKKEYPWLFGPAIAILELGCGVGNSLAGFSSDALVRGCDFSETAVAISQKRFPNFRFWACDIATADLGKCDVAVAIFVLSAIDPANHAAVLRNIYGALSAGGKLIFRDFGRYDYRQVRYKPDQAVKPNFYRKGDGTFAYFFTKDEIAALAGAAGFKVAEIAECKSLTVNRKTKFEMYRVILKCVFEK